MVVYGFRRPRGFPDRLERPLPLQRRDPDMQSPSLITTTLAGKSRFGPVPTEFVYDAAVPFQVAATFSQGARSTTWTFARDLLVEAMRTGRSGIGDVLVQQLGGEITLLIKPGAAGVVIAYSRMEMSAFVAKTLALVPHGSETMPDLDDELARLLND